MAQQSSTNPTSLTNLGAANFGTDNRALYLDLFSGEMIKGFEYNAIARDLVMKRTLKTANLCSSSTRVA